MGRVRLRDKTAGVEHDRIVRAGVVRFDLGQDGVEQIGVMNLRIEDVRWRPAHLARDQAQPALRVNRRLVLREHDQGRPALVEARIHPGGDLDPAGERETNVDADRASGWRRGCA